MNLESNSQDKFEPYGTLIKFLEEKTIFAKFIAHQPAISLSKDRDEMKIMHDYYMKKFQ